MDEIYTHYAHHAFYYNEHIYKFMPSLGTYFVYSISLKPDKVFFTIHTSNYNDVIIDPKLGKQVFCFLHHPFSRRAFGSNCLI